MAEIVHQAVICHVKLLGPGVLDAVVQNNDSVCGHDNPRALKKLRELLIRASSSRRNRSTASGHGDSGAGRSDQGAAQAAPGPSPT